MCTNCLSTAEATIAGVALASFALKPRVHRALARAGLAHEPDAIAHDVTTVRFLRSLDLDPVDVLGADVVAAAEAWLKPQPTPGWAGVAGRLAAAASARPIGSHSLATPR